MLKTKGENNNNNKTHDTAVVKYYTTLWSFEEKVVKTLIPRNTSYEKVCRRYHV